MEYHDFTLEAADAKRTLVEKVWQTSYTLRLIASPAGAHDAASVTAISFTGSDLAPSLAKLDQRTLDQAGLIELGRKLAALLLPTAPAVNSIYDLFLRSQDIVGAQSGIRLRLRLPPLLAVLPWEYLYADRVGNPESMDGFLALNPRIAIVREELQPTPTTLEPLAGPIKVVAAFASPEDLPALDLAKEQADLRSTLDQQEGIQPTYLEQATLDELLSNIIGASVFHFAGHGKFVRQPQDMPGVYSGEGGLALFDQYINAEQLAINLNRGGVRLAMLGGCETGRRDQISVWSGIAPTLVRAQAQIPAVVANQYPIKDVCAIAFSKHFYQALVAGLVLEEAVAAGRLAAYNADTAGRDWGVPVLYLRPGDGQLFAGAEDEVIRQAARKEAELNISMRVTNVAAGGYLQGADIGTMRSGLINVSFDFGTMSGSVLGAEIDSATGGVVNFDVEADELKDGGDVTAVRLDSFG
jgi:CHAT domain